MHVQLASFLGRAIAIYPLFRLNDMQALSTFLDTYIFPAALLKTSHALYFGVLFLEKLHCMQVEEGRRSVIIVELWGCDHARHCAHRCTLPPHGL